MLKQNALLAAAFFVVSTSQLVNAQERQWLLDAAAEDAFLIYGVPDTNDVAVSFWCKLGSKKVHMFTTTRGVLNATQELNIDLGVHGKNFVLGATLNADNQPPTAEAELVPQDIIINALKAADSLSVTLLDHKNIYPLADADWDGLLTLCQKPLLSAE